MMNNLLFRVLLFLILFIPSISVAQKSRQFNLNKLFTHKGLVFYPNQQVNTIDDPKHPGVAVTGIVWLKNVSFSRGSIDVDIRGKDVFQQSFLGIAFHGVDTVTYDAIYFRPFNFQTSDTLRRKHMVQYMSEPDYPWDRLRNEHPLIYEGSITPSPEPSDWFHAHIEVGYNEIAIFVNYATVASLRVKKLNSRNSGLIGLWSSALSGDFANLEIKTNP